ncbi:MAG: four helix bundle protein [Ignavibacteriae bacterium]|nr:four helix bundle protein [Ignavibacteriota bacterium]
MAKGDDIQDRLINFSVEIIKLCEKLPDTPAGKHIANQLLRSGTSPAPNYGEARGAESKRDFFHKLGVVLKELNESVIWLEVTKRSSLLSAQIILPILDECGQLSKIISSSISTARGGNK